MKTALAFLLLAFVLVQGATPARAAPVTNADIEKLLAAGMGDDVILNVIAGGESKFDTSPDALIALKGKGASPAVLAAITGRNIPPATPAAPIALPVADARAAMESLANANDVIFIDGDKRSSMTYSTPDMRMAGMLVSAVTFGFGGRMYWTLSGPHAELRTKNQHPVFLVSVPRNTKPEQSVTLTRWAIRSNGTREILTERFSPADSVALQSGPRFPKDRVIAIELNPAKDLATGVPIPGRYEVRAKNPLTPDEYVLVLGMQAYDFGVDS